MEDSKYLLLGGENSIEIINSQFTNCKATNYNGGSIYATSEKKSNFDFLNCTIKSNSISSAIFFDKIDFIFKDCNFNDNSVSDNDLPSVINCRSSDGSIENCNFFNNNVRKDDMILTRSIKLYGAIYFSEVNCIFKECLFSNNVINVGYRTAIGAALFGSNSNFNFEKSNFSNNHLNKENHLDYNDHLYGGAINLRNSFSSFNECLLDSNYVHCDGISSHGGALYIERTHCNFTNCTFSNNYASSGNDKSYGGVGFLTSSNCKFEDCFFDFNIGKSNRGDSNGGVFYFDQSDGEFKKCLINSSKAVTIHGSGNGAFVYSKSYGFNTISFENCTILNSLAYSYNYANGGAFYIVNTKVNFIDIFFINNTVFTHALNACGGVSINEESTGNFENCTFFNNSVEMKVGSFPSTDDEPRSLGGTLHLKSCSFTFNECKFENNFCLGYSNKYDSTSYGGGIYAIESNINITKSDFINHTLYNNGNKFEFECAIKGSACYFLNSTAYLKMCNFINNTASLNAIKITKYFDAKVLGGAIYSSNKNLTCDQCTFLNNYVKVNNLKEREFGGSIYLSHGKLTNCSFCNNAAYNGGEIVFEQSETSFLEINNCVFIENELIKQDVKSIIQIQESFGSSNEITNIFANNKFVINITSILFDGEIKRTNENDTKICEVKFNFDKNCISQFNEQTFKTDEIIIFDEKGKEITKLESVFESQCDELEQPTIPVIPTEQIKSPIESIETFDTQTESYYFTTEPTEVQTEQLKTPTKSTVIQTESIEITTKPTEFQTESIEITTKPTEVQTESIEITTMTKTEQPKTLTKSTVIQTEPIETTTMSKTEQQKTPTKSTVIQTEPIETTSEPTEIQTELSKTPTESLIQPTNVKTNKKSFKDFGISFGQFIGIVCGIFSIILTIIIVLIIIFISKKRKKSNGEYEDFLFNLTEIESSNHNTENIVEEDNQSISTVNPNDYFEILI